MAKGDALEGGSIQPRFPNLNSSEFFSDGASRFLGWSFLFVFIEFVVLILWAISDVILSKVIIQMLFGRWATFKSWGAGILQLLTSDLLTFSSAPSLGSAGPTHLLVRGEGQPRIRRRMRSRLERVKWNPIIIIRRRLWLFPFSLFFSSCQIAATNIGGWCTDTIFFLDWKMHNGLPVSIHQSNRFILVPDIFSSLPSVLVSCDILPRQLCSLKWCYTEDSGPLIFSLQIMKTLQKCRLRNAADLFIENNVINHIVQVNF